jgi:hypothetical protein
MNSPSESLAWFQAITSLVISWPVVVLILLLVFRKRLRQLYDRLLSGEQGRIEVAGIKLELGKLVREGHTAVQSLHHLNILMAKSRLLELEITRGFSPVFTDEQNKLMKHQIAELESIDEAERALAENGQQVNLTK